jgi:hydroxypyruvate isomerase
VPKFAANLGWMFTELPFMERFEAAAAAGFKGVEFPFPYDYSPNMVANALARHNLTGVLFNLPAGDWEGGERGIAALPGREAEFNASVDLAISYARIIGTRRLHVLSGIVPAEVPRRLHWDIYLANLRDAARRAEPHGITLLVEAINPVDMPGYLIRTQAESFNLCAAVQATNVRMQLDLYHLQMTEGGLATALRRYRTTYGHVQIASVPGRSEPDTGEINYPYLFGLLDELGYDGWVGCEYKPKGETVEGLGWLPSQSG